MFDIISHLSTFCFFERLVIFLLPLFVHSEGRCEVDVVFVLDASSSVRGTFERMVELTRSIGEHLLIAPEAHHVALVEFSGPTRKWIELGFDAFKSNEQFQKRLDRLLYLQGR